MLQLPHFTEKECAKIRKKAKSLAELREMAKEERSTVLEKFAEFDENKRADVETIMNIVPKVVKFECEIFCGRRVSFTDIVVFCRRPSGEQCRGCRRNEKATKTTAHIGR